MKLIKEIKMNKSGADPTYWHLSDSRVNDKAKKARLIFTGYLNKAVFEAGGDPLADAVIKYYPENWIEYVTDPDKGIVTEIEHNDFDDFYSNGVRNPFEAGVNNYIRNVANDGRLADAVDD